MDAHQPDWRAGKTPAAVVYARSENGWFSWLIAELETEINDPQGAPGATRAAEVRLRQ